MDGGLAAFRATRRRPLLLVGDLDSVDVPTTGLAVKRYPVAKDYSDFAGALEEAKRLRARVVVVAGLLGGRLDHEWANLLEAAAAAKHFAGILALSLRAQIVLTARYAAVDLLEGTLVSTFALSGPARLSLSGTQWALTRRRLVPGSHGLSNVASGTVELTVHAGVIALVVPSGTAQSSRNRKTSRAIRPRSSKTVP